MKKIVLLLCAVMLALPLCAFAEEWNTGVWNERSFSYTDAEGNAAEMLYEVYLPASYDGTTPLPLVTYIPDSGYVDRGVKAVETAECPRYWLTDELTAKHPAIWMILDLSNPDSDVRVPGNQSAQIVPIIGALCQELPVDTDRLYLVGQSMGGIMHFALNTFYPDRFAATVYVSCQPGGEVHNEIYDEILEAKEYLSQKFVYISSRLDVKAHVGQDDVEQAMLDAGVEYGKLYDLYHKSETLDDEVASLLSQGYERNLLGFAQIVATDDGSVSIMEHLKSFTYAFKIPSIMDWLFAQSK